MLIPSSLLRGKDKERGDRVQRPFPGPTTYRFRRTFSRIPYGYPADRVVCDRRRRDHGPRPDGAPGSQSSRDAASGRPRVTVRLTGLANRLRANKQGHLLSVDDLFLFALITFDDQIMNRWGKKNDEIMNCLRRRLIYLPPRGPFPSGYRLQPNDDDDLPVNLCVRHTVNVTSLRTVRVKPRRFFGTFLLEHLIGPSVYIGTHITGYVKNRVSSIIRSHFAVPFRVLTETKL